MEQFDRRRSAPPRWLTVSPAVVVGAAAIATIVTMGWAAGLSAQDVPSDPIQVLITVLFVAWNLVPHAWAFLLIRRMTGTFAAAAVVAAGSLLFAAVDGWFLRDFFVSESSTSALVFLTLPFLLGAVLVPVQIVVLVLLGRARRTR
jgi:hypothetical protein